MTAAHCICWFDDTVLQFYPDSKKEFRPSLRCLPNIERIGKNGVDYIEYENQIQDRSNGNFNHIYFVLGAKTFPKFDRGAGSSTSFKYWSKADKAIVMDTPKSGNDVIFSGAYDVGLIVVPKMDGVSRSKHITIHKRYAGTKTGYVDE